LDDRKNAVLFRKKESYQALSPCSSCCFLWFFLLFATVRWFSPAPRLHELHESCTIRVSLQHESGYVVRRSPFADVIVQP